MLIQTNNNLNCMSKSPKCNLIPSPFYIVKQMNMLYLQFVLRHMYFHSSTSNYCKRITQQVDQFEHNIKIQCCHKKNLTSKMNCMISNYLGKMKLISFNNFTFLLMIKLPQLTPDQYEEALHMHAPLQHIKFKVWSQLELVVQFPFSDL